ncbi:MAG: TolC family protein [Cystobacterineae bacterium]|nr:TolC family protein [Cystobacterineae bacterium]
MWTFLVLALLHSTPITLEEVRQAARDNLDALKAELALASSHESARQARSSIFPQLSAELSASQTWAGSQRYAFPQISKEFFDVAPYNQTQLGLRFQLQQLIYDGGRWWKQIAKAGFLKEAAEGELAEQRLVSEAEGARRFFELLKTQIALEVLENAQQRSVEQLERAKALFEAGRAPKLDWLNAEINLGSDTIRVVLQRQAITKAQVDLLQWLARPYADIRAEHALNSTHSTDEAVLVFEEVLDIAQNRRPLFFALSKRLEAASSAISLASAGYWPSIFLSLQYQRDSTELKSFVSDWKKQNVLLGMFNLRWTLFDGFATASDKALASIEQTRVQKDLQQAEIQLSGDVQQALVLLAVQREVLKLAKQNRQKSEEGLALSSERFVAGQGSSLEIRDAQLRLLETELTEQQNRIDLEIAWVLLERVIGGSLEKLR